MHYVPNQTVAVFGSAKMLFYEASIEEGKSYCMISQDSLDV